MPKVGIILSKSFLEIKINYELDDIKICYTSSSHIPEHSAPDWCAGTNKVYYHLDSGLAKFRHIFLDRKRIPKRLNIRASYTNIGKYESDESALVVWSTIHLDQENMFLPGSYLKWQNFKHAYEYLCQQHKEKYEKWLKHGLVDHEVTLSEINFKNQSAKFCDYFKIYRNILGEFCGALPVPTHGSENNFPAQGPVMCEFSFHNSHLDFKLTPSAAMNKNLKHIDEAINSGDKQIIWLQGDSGSGKNVMAEIVHGLSVHPTSKPMVKYSVAGMSSDYLQEILFGREIKGVHIEGLIAKAEDSTLFLDEFDKVGGQPHEFYSALLRVLENEEYAPVGSKDIKKIKNVNWIFAGVFNKETLEHIPQDFHSRITHQIELENPLLNKNGTLNQNYFVPLFLYFYVVSLCKYLNVTPDDIADFNSINYNVLIARLALDASPPFHEIDMLVPTPGMLTLANKLATKIKKSRLKGITARSVRQTARRVAVMMFQDVINHFTLKAKVQYYSPVFADEHIDKSTDHALKIINDIQQRIGIYRTRRKRRII
ncbi:MAG: sigma 54-interacting transcriptional regulator [Thermodesulfobacteriota bacterium]